MMPIQYKKHAPKKETGVFNSKISCILCNEKLNTNTMQHNCNVRQYDDTKTIVIRGPK